MSLREVLQEAQLVARIMKIYKKAKKDPQLKEAWSGQFINEPLDNITRKLDESQNVGDFFKERDGE